MSQRKNNSWISVIFVSLISFSPRLKRTLWNKWYNLLAKNDSRGLLASMNYGYINSDSNPVSEPEPQLTLYDKVLGNIPIEQKKVIEIGSGRGAGAAYLCEKFSPALYIGMDLAIHASLNSTSTPNTHMLHFMSGDALAIPVRAGSMDIVINIESSHCYASLQQFFLQVSEVLAPNGMFCYCDLMPAAQARQLPEYFSACNLTVRDSEDITANILASLDSRSDENSKKIHDNIPWYLRKTFADFAGIKNTGVYNLFKSGKLVYYRFIVQKRPAATTASAGNRF